MDKWTEYENRKKEIKPDQNYEEECKRIAKELEI